MIRREAATDIAFIALLCTAATILSFGETVCRFESAEDLALAMNSTYSPSLYFPGSNRGGNVGGLLFSWVHEVDWNLQAQTGLRILSALAWPYLVARLFTRAGNAWLITAIFHAVTLSQISQMNYVVYHSSHPYSASLFFMTIGVVLLQRNFVGQAKGGWWALPLGFAASFTANWIAPNSGILTILIAVTYFAISTILGVAGLGRLTSSETDQLTPARAWPWERGGRRTLVAALVIIAPLFFSIALSSWYAAAFPQAVRSFSEGSYTQLNLSFEGLFKSVEGIWTLMGGPFLAVETIIAVLALIAMITLTLRGFDSQKNLGIARGAWVFLTSVALAAVGFTIVTSQIAHVAMNGYHVRYFVYAPLTFVFIFSVACTAAIRFIITRLRAQTVRTGVTVLTSSAFGLIAAGCSVGWFGAPKAPCAFNHGVSEFSKWGVGANKEGYFALLGSYWDVWPVTFHAWIAGSNKPVSERLLPTGYRSETFADVQYKRYEALLRKDGEVRMLCLGVGKESEYGYPVDCAKLVEWNQAWGVFPKLGHVRVEPAPPVFGPASAVVVIDFPEINKREIIDVSSKGTRETLVAGWETHPNDTAAWTIGSMSILEFMMSCNAGDRVSVTVDNAAWIGSFAGGAPLDVEMKWNGVSFLRQSFDGSSMQFRGRVPGEAIECNAVNHLELAVHNPRRISDSDPKSVDSRLLGLAVKTIQIESIPMLDPDTLTPAPK